jgi:outer membrane protein OmpA-like peptidoglycan-associated protein
MTRSEARTPEAWRGFDRAALLVTLAGLLALLLLWWTGHGPSQASCCAAPVIAAPAVQPTPAPIPAAAPEPAKVEPAKAEPPPVVAAAPAPVKAEPPPVVAAAPAPANAEAPKVAPAVDCTKLDSGVAVFFATGSAVLSGEARVVLDQALLCVRDGRYEVAGHTDNVGDKAMNQRLSEARAKAVVAYLRSKGIDASRLVSRGYGETKPIADNGTADGRAQNRRITFTRLS